MTENLSLRVELRLFECFRAINISLFGALTARLSRRLTSGGAAEITDFMHF
jgi:hypothetical protein